MKGLPWLLPTFRTMGLPALAPPRVALPIAVFSSPDRTGLGGQSWRFLSAHSRRLRVVSHHTVAPGSLGNRFKKFGAFRVQACERAMR